LLELAFGQQIGQVVERAEAYAVSPIFLVQQHTVFHTEQTYEYSEALTEGLGDLGRGHYSIFNVPVDVFGVHVEGDSELVGFFSRGRVPSESPTCALGLLVELAIFDHAVAAVVANEELVVLLVPL